MLKLLHKWGCIHGRAIALLKLTWQKFSFKLTDLLGQKIVWASDVRLIQPTEEGFIESKTPMMNLHITNPFLSEFFLYHYNWGTDKLTRYMSCLAKKKKSSHIPNMNSERLCVYCAIVMQTFYSPFSKPHSAFSFSQMFNLVWLYIVYITILLLIKLSLSPQIQTTNTVRYNILHLLNAYSS